MDSPTSKRFLLIDGNALVHRAFHALPPLNSPKGELVNAVYGFTSVLLKAIKEINPFYIICAFDLPEPTFRHLEYEEYKATRPKTPEELSKQFSGVKEIVKSFGIPIFEKTGFEADDILGTLCKMSKKQDTGVENIIITGDLDTFQLIDKNTKVYTLKKGVSDTVIYDEEGVKKRYDGLSPEQLKDFKGLVGDPSDNIPGIPGIGEKTAIILIKKFKTIENMCEQIVKPDFNLKNVLARGGEKLKEKLMEYKDQALFSRMLATIKTDVPLDFKLENCRWGDYDREKIISLFNGFGFRSLIGRLPSPENQKGEEGGETITDANQVKKNNTIFLIEQNYKQGIFSKEIYDLEKQLIPVIEEMGRCGIKIDLDKFKIISKELNSKIKEYKSQILGLAGEKFNINSSQQISEILFKKLKILPEGLKKTAGGVISTAAPQLKKLREKHPIVNLILKYRELAKLKNTYIDALPKLVDQKTSRLHTTFNQLGAETGRISSSRPNLQNIPIKGEWGEKIRELFIADKGWSFISADYSQIELRIAASIADDEKMIEAFKRGEDIHALTASQVYNIPINEVTSDMRRTAKALNFGVLYGMSVHGFTESAGVGAREAKKFINEYMGDFQGIAKYIETIKNEAKEKGYVQTLLGRKRYLPEIHSSNFRFRQAAERMAINMPIQGTAADIVKLAMVKIYDFLKRNKIDENKPNSRDCRLILQIHDELLIEARDDIIKEASEKIKEIMESVYPLKVPLEIKISAGKNWM